MHKSQILFYSLLAFIAGIFAASVFEISQARILVLIIGAVSALAMFGYHGNYSRKGVLGGFLSLVVIFGIIRFNAFDLSNSILSEFADVKVKDRGVEVQLNGYVDEQPDVNGNQAQFIFRAKELIVPDRKIAVDERVLIKTEAFPKYEFGDKLSVTGSLEKPRNFSEDFDYVTYLKKQSVGTTSYFPKIEETTLELGFWENSKINLYKNIFGIKDKFENSINRIVAEPNASYLNGILLGSRQDIPTDLKDAFNKTGTTHILAISGYNIMIIASTLLAGLVFFVRRRTAFWISLGIILAFTIMTGSSASVVRASLMGLLLLFAQGYGRMYEARNSIVLAGAVMVFLNPYILVFDIGFQLSFLAVIGLVYLYPYLSKKSEKIPESFGFKEAFLATVSAQAFVFLPLLFYFKQFSLVSLPANVLILPFTPFAMLSGFLTGITGLVSSNLGQLIGLVAWTITTYQIWVIKLLS